jgi:nucleoside-diphosphate-sugar epimerase
MFAYIGRQPAIAPYVHVDDVVDLLVQCSRAELARNEVFNLSHDCPLPEMITGLAAAVGVNTPRLWVPESLARALAACATIFGVKVLTGSRIDALVARTSYPGDKAARLLGFRPRIAVPQSMGEVVHGTSYPPNPIS